jgi:hypothetical protein
LQFLFSLIRQPDTKGTCHGFNSRHRYAQKSSPSSPFFGKTKKAPRPRGGQGARAERRAGEFIRDQPKAPAGRPPENRSEPATDSPATYAEQGIDKRDASVWQRIAEISEERFEQFISEAPEITTAGALRLAKENVHFSSKTDEWTTPADIVARVILCLGEIDIDPCSDEQDTVPAKIHLHEKENGLEEIWRGRVYMNPPYGDVIPAWVEKLIAEHNCGNTREAIALVPSRTDTQWFRKFSPFPRCFISGRLKFGGQENSAPFPSMLVYLGKNVSRFKETFSDLGDIYGRL